jgi:hypothetical protein
MKIVAIILSKIKTYPMVFGMLIGLMLILGIIVCVNWFPGVSEAWDKHDSLVRSTWFTAGFFGVWLNFYWDLRRRGFFLASICILFLLHTGGIVYYTTQVRPPTLQNWIILLAAESFVLVSYLEWSIQRFGHTGRRRHTE